MEKQNKKSGWFYFRDKFLHTVTCILKKCGKNKMIACH